MILPRRILFFVRPFPVCESKQVVWQPSASMDNFPPPDFIFSSARFQFARANRFAWQPSAPTGNFPRRILFFRPSASGCEGKQVALQPSAPTQVVFPAGFYFSSARFRLARANRSAWQPSAPTGSFPLPHFIFRPPPSGLREQTGSHGSHPHQQIILPAGFYFSSARFRCARANRFA